MKKGNEHRVRQHFAIGISSGGLCDSLSGPGRDHPSPGDITCSVALPPQSKQEESRSIYARSLKQVRHRFIQIFATGKVERTPAAILLSPANPPAPFQIPTATPHNPSPLETAEIHRSHFAAGNREFPGPPQRASSCRYRSRLPR